MQRTTERRVLVYKIVQDVEILLNIDEILILF